MNIYNFINTVKTHRKMILLVGIVVMAVASTIAVLAINDNQDIRQRAASNDNPQGSGKSQQQSPSTGLQTPNTVAPTITPTPALYTAPNDTVQPTVSLVGMDTDAQVQAGTQKELTAEATDDLGVGNVEFLVNGTIICSSATPFTCNWTVPEETNIQYVLTVRAFDLTGNVSTKSVVVTSY